jgi:hypothetical protein
MRPQVGFFGLNSTKLYNYFYFFASGALTLGSYERNFLSRLGRVFSLKGCADNPINIHITWFTKKPDILRINWFAKNPDKWKRYLRTMICFLGTSKSIDTKYEYSLQITW